MKVAVITITFALVVTGKKFLVETEDSGHRNHGKVGKWGVHHEKGNELGQNISFTSFECFNESIYSSEHKHLAHILGLIDIQFFS